MRRNVSTSVSDAGAQPCAPLLTGVIATERRGGSTHRIFFITGRASMDRRTASLAQARRCRQRAVIDLDHAAFWLAEAVKWERRAAEEIGPLAISIEQLTKDGAAGRTPSALPKKI